MTSLVVGLLRILSQKKNPTTTKTHSVYKLGRAENRPAGHHCNRLPLLKAKLAPCSLSLPWTSLRHSADWCHVNPSGPAGSVSKAVFGLWLCLWYTYVHREAVHCIRARRYAVAAVAVAAAVVIVINDDAMMMMVMMVIIMMMVMILMTMATTTTIMMAMRCCCCCCCC